MSGILSLSSLRDATDSVERISHHLSQWITRKGASVDDAATNPRVLLPSTTTTPAVSHQETNWIVHLGVGGFHRAHMALYTDEAAEGPSRTEMAPWSILATGLRKEDRPLLENLSAQGGRYTLMERHGSQETIRVVSSIKETLWAASPEGCLALLKRIASKSTRVVSLTVTPTGYYLDAGKNLDLTHPVVQSDIDVVAHAMMVATDEQLAQTDLPSLLSPNSGHCQTPVGVVCLGLLCRHHALGRPQTTTAPHHVGEAPPPPPPLRAAAGRITVLSCDNIQHNGSLLRASVAAFMEGVVEVALRISGGVRRHRASSGGAAVDPAAPSSGSAATPAEAKDIVPRVAAFLAWLQAACAFPCSMVDRITPATTVKDVAYLLQRYQIADRCPVVCEPFRQWVIERDNDDAPANDEFPLWRGVQFVRDVAPYETMKLRLLNGSHLAVACLGELMGLTYIHETMQNDTLHAYMKWLMQGETGPTVPVVHGIDLESYKKTLLERFGNAAIQDTVERVATDAPLAVLIATMHDRISCFGAGAEAMSPLLMLAIAAWVLRTSGGCGETGRRILVKHPMASKLATFAAQCGGSHGLIPLQPLLSDIFGASGSKERGGGSGGSAVGSGAQEPLMSRPTFVQALTTAWQQLQRDKGGVEVAVKIYLGKSQRVRNSSSSSTQRTPSVEKSKI